MEWIDRQVIGKDPDAGKIEGRRSGQQRMRWLDGITHSMDVSLSKFGRQERTGKPAILQSIGCKELDATLLLNNNNNNRIGSSTEGK